MGLRTIAIPGAKAVSALSDYRSQYPNSGEYPFMIGDRHDLARVAENIKFCDRSPEEIIQASIDIDAADWLATRKYEAEEEQEFEFPVEHILGEWPGEILEKESTSIHTDILTRNPKPEVYLGFVRIQEPWHLPAILKYGNWNECPEPEVHCAFFRRWLANFGAQITGMSGDVVECVVSDPPRTRDTAIALAWEQYWFCRDIVDQGCETVSNLAATLLNSPYWFFWWD